MTPRFIRVRLLCLAALLIAVIGVPRAARASTVLLAAGSQWEYSFCDPTATAWNQNTGLGMIDGCLWQAGTAPFSGAEIGWDVSGYDPDFTSPSTTWMPDGYDGDDLWLRQRVDFGGLSGLRWALGADNGFKLYLNGELVSEGNAEGYTFRWEYQGDFDSLPILDGWNIIAVALEDHGGLTAFDMEISSISREVVPMPEPGTLALLGLGGALVVATRKRLF